LIGADRPEAVLREGRFQLSFLFEAASASFLEAWERPQKRIPVPEADKKRNKPRPSGEPQDNMP